jgi:hypothetical protein
MLGARSPARLYSFGSSVNCVQISNLISFLFALTAGCKLHIRNVQFIKLYAFCTQPQLFFGAIRVANSTVLTTVRLVNDIVERIWQQAIII